MGTAGTGPAVLATGACCAWPLPLDATCAAEARRLYRDAMAGLRLSGDLAYDGVTMASELAANSLHAQRNVDVGLGRWPVAGGPEMWLYLRRAGDGWELVCKIFDSLSGWHPGPAPAAAGAGPERVNGRGLQVVAGLSGGRWGHHLTRARLGGWKVSGKAVWFALPVPDQAVPARLQHGRLGPSQAARKLEMMLADRGLGGSLLRADEPGEGMSVLSVRRGLTVWCRGSLVSWRTWAGGYEQRMLTDLEDVAEQVVCICEEMDRSIGTAPGFHRVR